MNCPHKAGRLITGHVQHRVAQTATPPVREALCVRVEEGNEFGCG